MASGDTINLGRPCKVCIDPGHGGRNSGAYANGLVEKDWNLRIALLLADRLHEGGHTPILTRDGDTYIGLTDRGHFSVAQESDLFVSVHHDDARPNVSRRGCSAFVRYESYRNGMDLGRNIAVSLNEQFEHGFAYGRPVQKHWVNLGVLRGGNNDGLVTATLVECACLSNVQDAVMIRAEGYVEKAAFAIYRGIQRHLALPVEGGTEPTNRVKIIGLDGVARPVGWLNPDGISYAPIRTVIEACGRKLEWDPETRTVTVNEAADA